MVDFYRATLCYRSTCRRRVSVRPFLCVCLSHSGIVVAEFLLTSASRGPSAIAEPLVFPHLFQVSTICGCGTDVLWPGRPSINPTKCKSTDKTKNLQYIINIY